MEKCVFYAVPSLCPLPWPCTATHPPVHTLCLTSPLFYCTRCTLYKHCLIIPLPPLPSQEAPGYRRWEGTAAELSHSAAAGLATGQDGRYLYMFAASSVVAERQASAREARPMITLHLRFHYVCISILIFIYRSIWHCTLCPHLAQVVGHTLPKRALPMRGPDLLAGPCTARGIQHL